MGACFNNEACTGTGNACLEEHIESFKNNLPRADFVTSVLLLILSLAITLFLAYKRRVRCFEAKILLCLLLYYSVSISAGYDVNEENFEYDDSYKTFIIESAKIILPKLTYWIFVLQYQKACSLLPGFIERTLSLK